MLAVMAVAATWTQTWINRRQLARSRALRAVGDLRTCRSPTPVREAETGVTVRNVASNCLSLRTDQAGRLVLVYSGAGDDRTCLHRGSTAGGRGIVVPKTTVR